MRTRISATLGAALLVLALTSCSEDPEPIIDRTPTTPTPTASDPPDSPTPTSSPPAEPESAKAFIRRWQQASFDMQNSGDTSTYLSLSKGCTSCEALATGISDIYEDGGSVRNSRGEISGLTRVGKVDSTLIYEFSLSTEESAVLNDDGTVRTRLTGGKSQYQINVVRDVRTWTVRKISRISS